MGFFEKKLECQKLLNKKWTQVRTREARKKFLKQCQKSYLCPKDHRKNRVIYWGGYIPGNITGAISFLLNITGAIAPVAPVLNTPL